uniref:Uncharacterized protein n=1 Tax=Arundo donax TaxID=35708 RepID=A0A0A9T5P0_ARUDO
MKVHILKALKHTKETNLLRKQNKLKTSRVKIMLCAQ